MYGLRALTKILCTSAHAVLSTLRKQSEEFAASATGVVADVDCTKDDAKDLCSRMGVKGYPTIKYFTETTAATGDSYEGGRTYADLKKWADENLGPSCSPTSLDLCNDEQTAEIEKYQAMDVSELEEVRSPSLHRVNVARSQLLCAELHHIFLFFSSSSSSSPLPPPLFLSFPPVPLVSPFLWRCWKPL